MNWPQLKGLFSPNLTNPTRPSPTYSQTIWVRAMGRVSIESVFHDEEAAVAWLEGSMWPEGNPSRCPHCGVADRMDRLAAQRMEDKPLYGFWKCSACRTQFSARTGTVFEDGCLELRQWLHAWFLTRMDDTSSYQLHRTLGCTLETALFVYRRLREDRETTGGNQIRWTPSREEQRLPAPIVILHPRAQVGEMLIATAERALEMIRDLPEATRQKPYWVTANELLRCAEESRRKTDLNAADQALRKALQDEGWLPPSSPV